MDLHTREILFVAAVVVYLGTPLPGRQEKNVRVLREITIPDSLKHQLSPKADEARVRKNWGALKRGMLFKEVDLLLGRPTKIASSVYDHSITWYYSKRYVIFDSVKNTVRYWEDTE